MAGGFDLYLSGFRARYPDVPAGVAHRLVRAYGTRAEEILADGDQGEDFGCGLTQAEVRFLVRAEFALTADDILWRRGKLGLHVPDGAAAAITRYIATLT
jgi:glycerol-3-phosphate dehydrogenase